MKQETPFERRRIGMFHHAPKGSFCTARSLRNHSTSAEKILWSYLRNRQLCNLKFRRQHAVSVYIVDFFCVEKNIVIEVDGKIHDDLEHQESDRLRTAELNRRELKVLRFTNEEVIHDIEKVLFIIRQSLNLSE